MTKTEFLTNLKEHNALRVARHGTTNVAIDKHIAKIEPMTEEQFAVHYASLRAPDPAKSAAAKRMASVFKK
jgi:hypothetical protein